MLLAEAFQKDPIVFQEYHWKAEEIYTDLTNTSWRA